MELTQQHVETIAAGLFAIAQSDGITEGEQQLIEEFVIESGFPELVGTLGGAAFDPVEAFDVLDSSWLRKIFLGAATLVVASDGTVSDQERETLAWIAEAFGIEGGYEAILTEVAGAQLA